jgi:hypothetical protein
LETILVEGSAWKRFFDPEERRIAGIGQQTALPPPKRRSPGHALIEFVRRFRVGEWVARNALFVEKDGFRVVLLLPCGGPRAGAIRGGVAGSPIGN